jgi:hypothetical protein
MEGSEETAAGEATDARDGQCKKDKQHANATRTEIWKRCEEGKGGKVKKDKRRRDRWESSREKRSSEDETRRGQQNEKGCASPLERKPKQQGRPKKKEMVDVVAWRGRRKKAEEGEKGRSRRCERRKWVESEKKANGKERTRDGNF